MSTLFSLEADLKRQAGKSKCRNCSFWGCYTAMAKYLAEQYYPWVQANCPWFTDHGEKHVQSVINTANLLLSNVPKGGINCLDMFLLLSAIIWHDVGMVAARAGHAAAASEFIARVADFCFPDVALKRLVSLMTRAHSGTEGWASLQSSEEVAPCAHKTCTVSPQSLAAVLRFADEISETRTRISPALLGDVPESNRLYWEYANCVTASTPEPKRNRILLSLEVQVPSALARHPCPEDLSQRADHNGKISLIEYIVCRLEKMNNERVYCFPYLTRYANITSIEVRLQVCNGPDCRLFDGIVIGENGLGNLGYPHLQVYERFFESYPALAPAALQEGKAT